MNKQKLYILKVKIQEKEEDIGHHHLQKNIIMSFHLNLLLKNLKHLKGPY